MNYFELFELSPSFDLDEKALKKTYIRKSRESHPDFHMNENEDIRQKMSSNSVDLNKGYQILKDKYSRYEHILDLYLADKGEQSLQQSFLMEMMDINEELMELEFDYSKDKASKLQHLVTNLENEEWQILEDEIKAYNFSVDNQELLKKVEQFLLKRKYFLRISNNLNKFARS